MLRVLALIATLAPLQSQAQQARIVGRVLSSENGEAIAGATVRVGPLQEITDQRGRFVLGPLAPGQHVIALEMIGYQSRTDTVTLAEGTHDFVVRLGVRAVRLPPVSVVVRSQWLDENGYYQRRDRDGIKGRFIDRAEIERKDPMFLTDLFRDVSGARVHRYGPGTSVIRFSRASAGGLSAPGGASRDDARQNWVLGLPGCQPDLFIDGRQHYDRTVNGAGLIMDFNMLNPIALEALEIYVGANVPTQYRNNGCGVVLIWTRRGR
jgi:hypothetical protein